MNVIIHYTLNLLCFTTLGTKSGVNIIKRNVYLLALFISQFGTTNEWLFSAVEKKQRGSLIESDEYISER